MREEEFSLLFARLDDMSMRTAHGELCITDFLTPREEHFATEYLKRKGESFLFFGGYSGAERKRCYLLPDYMEDITSYESFSDYGIDSDIDALLVSGSGYRALSHRDFLGSVLSLGIDRCVIGDIVTLSDESAVVFCSSSMTDFLLSQLTHIANDKVSVKKYELPSDFLTERPTKKINDTVPSARLDAVIASLLSLSRERAKALVLSGVCEVDFEAEERPDRILTAPCMISLRGYGRFRINSLSELTRKGRIRLDAEKFI